jgi:hypothetical protein
VESYQELAKTEETLYIELKKPVPKTGLTVGSWHHHTTSSYQQIPFHSIPYF